MPATKRSTTGGTANRGTQSSLQRGGGHARRDGTQTNTRRNKNQAMSEQQILGFLGRKIYQSMNDEDGDLSDVRQENLNYYVGKEYGDERDGYSQFVTREALETVEWVMPSILRVFLSGDKIVEFDPTGPEDEKQASQETDITNHFIMGGKNGFIPLHHWMKDALMFPNGYLKVYMEETTKVDVGTVTGINAIGVQMLVEDPDVEIMEQRSRMITLELPQNPQQSQQALGGAPGGPGQAAGGQMAPNGSQTAPPPQMMQQAPPSRQVEVYDMKIRTTREVMELRLMPVPGDECLVDNDLTLQDLDEADFVCHRVRKTYTQLVREGIDPDELDTVGSGENYQWNDERVNRLFYEDEDPDAEDEDDPSMREFWTHECYAWFDNDGTGLAQQRRVLIIGDKVFDNEEVNYQPMISLSSILMQHKHTGMAYIDIMKDLQLLLSTLTRQLLDNIYKINVRRKVFSEDALTEDGATMEALLNTQAEFIPVRGPASQAFMPEPTQSIIGEILPVIQHFNEQRVGRTGVNPEATVDGNVLQEVRNDVFANAMDRASQRIEMLVRIFSETGYKQLMLKSHQLLRSHWDIAKTVKLRGTWVDVDPQGWRDRTDMTVGVGLGVNTKQIMLQMLTQIIAMQKEALPQGMSTPAQIHNTLEKIISAAGLGNVKTYFTDPESPDYKPPQPPPPDPNMILAQAQAKALEQDGQYKMQKMQVDSQTAMQKTQVDMQIKQAELADKQADRAIKEREMALKEIELQQNGKMSGIEMQQAIEETIANIQLKYAQADKTMVEAANIVSQTGAGHDDAVETASHAGEENDGTGEENES